VSPSAPLPDAAYLLLASRLIPGLDGGFAVSVMRRAGDIADATGEWPLLLTVDVADTAAHDAHRAEWVRRGMLGSPDRLRNLFDDARADRSWLVEAAHPVSEFRLNGGAGALGGPDAAAEPEFRQQTRLITDGAGEPVLEIPWGVGGAAWHLVDAPVRVYSEGGIVGELHGYRELYRAWVDHVAAQARAVPGRPVVLLCESRQIGEVLVDDGPGRGRPDVTLLHTTHACHLRAPFTWDAPMDPAWERWLAVADRFDGVLWLTPTQRDDVERRGYRRIRSFVVPHPAPPVTDVVADPRRVVMLNSLIPRKRVDHAVRAVARVPDARLVVYGDGPERERIAALAAELGVDLELAGHIDDPEDGWRGADVLLLTSESEGQPLVVLEALAHGVPVVAYDMPYGPRDTLADGGGILVPSGDVDALAAALAVVVGDRRRREELSAAGRAAAARKDAASSMRALGAAVTAEPRRAS
jgi:poly(glycerol-phosphate) alpha-glucosyltransferase